VSIEATLICDLCGAVVDAAETRAGVLAAVEREGTAFFFRIDGHSYHVCKKCVQEKGGPERAKRAMADQVR